MTTEELRGASLQAPQGALDADVSTALTTTASGPCAEFLAEFALPLVAGGEIKIGRPVDYDEGLSLELDLSNASLETHAVDEARLAALRTLVVAPAESVLNGEDLCLLAAVHNTLFLEHPKAASWTVSDRTLDRVVATATEFAQQPLASTPREALARHSLFHNLFRLRRVDTTVKWWRTQRTYPGQTPPRRVTAQPNLRRVEESQQEVGFAELFPTTEAMNVVQAVLRRSPLTLLLTAHPKAPAIQWEEAIFLLRDIDIARALVYNAMRSLAVGPDLATRYAAALDQMLDRRPAPADIRTVLSFLCYLCGMLAVDEANGGQLLHSHLTATLSQDDDTRPRALALFFALPSALKKVAPDLAVAPGVEDNRASLRTWHEHRRWSEGAVGKSFIEDLARRLSPHLT